VILKPSSDAPTIAAKFVEVLEEAGMPDGVVNFCPGSGATFAMQLSRIHGRGLLHSRARRRWVGDPRAGRPRPGRARSGSSGTILEMGGKDSILVCADADLDAAVERRDGFGIWIQRAEVLGVLAAIVEACRRRLLERLRERVAKLTVGDPAANHNLGPVINKGALASMLGYVEAGRRKAAGCGRQCAGDGGGRLFSGADRVCRRGSGRGAGAGRRYFGPVLAVIKGRELRKRV